MISPGRRHVATVPVAVVLMVISAGFATVHVAWALGWRVGIPDDVEPISQRPVFLTYDLVAAVLMYAAAVVAVLLARGGLPRRFRNLLVRATWVGSVLALLRGVPALAVDLVTGTVTGLGPVADTWFVVAGALGVALALSLREPTPAPARGRRLRRSSGR